jgi:hypothetical protein
MLVHLRKWGLVTGLSLALCVAGATTRVAAAGPEATTVSAADGSADEEKWWGAVGAVMCGGGIFVIRTNPVIGMNPYVLAATIGGCLLMALDCT